MLFESLSGKLANVFKKLRSKGKLTEADVRLAMREIKLALLEADVNYKVVKKFVERLTGRAVGSDVLESLTPAQQVVKIVNEELTVLMGEKGSSINIPSKPPCVLMMCGLQGDVYRPAAIDQLKIVGEKAGVHVFDMGKSDPVKIASASLKHAKDYGHDIVILDTAGRLHIDSDLMNELQRMSQSVNPSEILLVVDSMTGQDAVNVAVAFNEKLDLTGVVLTKLDGDSRGGAALSIMDVLGKPIKFVGVGEKLGDLELFQPDRMASRILGMGDVLTLIEKAESNIKARDAEKVARKIKENKFDMNDLLDQMNQIKKIGSIRDIVGMIPGVSSKIKDADLENGEARIIKMQAIILSMTRLEREKPSMIDSGRKRRIAAGSGTSVTDVNQLLKQFDQMQKMFKQLGGRGKRKKRRLFSGFWI